MLPDAPWTLSGEIIVARLRRPDGVAGALPKGLKPIPGPAIMCAGHWAQTPVGPFSELGVAVPARVGARPGLCVVLSVVTAPEARVAGRMAWGLPRQLGAIRWTAVGSRRTLVWEDGGVEVTAVVRGGSFPAGGPFRGLQRRSDGRVIVPIRMFGWVRRAGVAVASSTDELRWLTSPKKGFLISGRQLVMSPARQPRGKWRSLLAPVPQTEPGVILRGR